jgi:hypothetical protein
MWRENCKAEEVVFFLFKLCFGLITVLFDSPDIKEGEGVEDSCYKVSRNNNLCLRKSQSHQQAISFTLYTHDGSQLLAAAGNMYCLKAYN